VKTDLSAYYAPSAAPRGKTNGGSQILNKEQRRRILPAWLIRGASTELRGNVRRVGPGSRWFLRGSRRIIPDQAGTERMGPLQRGKGQGRNSVEREFGLRRDGDFLGCGFTGSGEGWASKKERLP